MASVFTTSPPSRSARSRESPVLPEAVAPTTATMGTARDCRDMWLVCQSPGPRPIDHSHEEPAMTDDQDQQRDSAQGPLDPSGPGGQEAQPPPGSPMRSDTPDGPVTPGEPVMDPGPQVQRVTRDEGGEAHEPDAGDTRGDPDPGEGALQRENAETSLDQPST